MENPKIVYIAFKSLSHATGNSYAIGPAVKKKKVYQLQHDVEFHPYFHKEYIKIDDVIKVFTKREAALVVSKLLNKIHIKRYAALKKLLTEYEDIIITAIKEHAE